MAEIARAFNESQRVEELERVRSFEAAPSLDRNLSQSGNVMRGSDDRTVGDRNYKNLKSHFGGISSRYRAKENARDYLKNKNEVRPYLGRGENAELERLDERYKKAKTLAGQTKSLAKSVTPWGFASLVGKMNFFADWPYALALLAALLKDGFDIPLAALEASSAATVVGVGVAAAAVVFGQVTGILSYIFITMMMILGNIIQPHDHDRTVVQSVVMKSVFKSKWFLRVVTIVGTFLFETFGFGANVFPAETVCVILIYIFALSERKGMDDALSKAV